MRTKAEKIQILRNRLKAADMSTKAGQKFWAANVKKLNIILGEGK